MARTQLPRRLTQLYIGLLLYGLAGALQVRSRLGLDPWDVFHQGLARHIGLAIGTVVIVVGAAVLVLWIPLRQRPGLGTVSNVVLIGVSMNVSLELLPPGGALGWRIAEMVGGIALCGVATGMYIGANFGPGPRDGLMTGLARTTGRSIRLTRTGIEVTILVVGWLLGGTVGIGTVAFALAIGPLAQLFLPIFDVARAPSAEILLRARGRGDVAATRSAGKDAEGGLVVVGPGQPGGEAVDRDLEVRMRIDEGL